MPEDFGTLTDFVKNEVNSIIAEPVNETGITLSRVVSVIHDLQKENQKVLRKTVLERLGYAQAGGASRKLNQIWDEALKQAQIPLIP
jgi:hypothetical protein